MSTATMWAQEPAAQAEDKETPLSKVERKNRAPVSKEVLKVTLPRAFETKIENGLTVLILEDHRTPLVTAELSIHGAGELYSPEGMPGIAHLTAMMLQRGTKGRKARQIAEDIEKLGASLSVSAPYGGESTTFSLSGIGETFEQAMMITADVLVNPIFPEEELAKLRQRELTGLQQQAVNPNFLVNQKFAEVLYGKHPAAIESTTADSLKAITREHLMKWHRERYAPQNAVLTIAGDVDPKDILGKVKRLSFVWTRQAYTPALPDVPKPATERKIHVVDRPGSVQTNLRLGNLAIDRRHEDFFPMVVMNRILGGGSSGRLFLNLREEKGYTYGVSSRVSAGRFTGPWSAGGSVRGDVTGESMAEFFKEIRRMAEEPVAAAELDEAKRALVANFALTLESPARVMSYVAERQRYGFPADYWDKYPERIAAVTAEDLQRVAKKYLNLEAMQIVAVGDAAKIQPALEKYGPVEVAGGSK
ncbi:MAG: insulinase family protein [Bryobacteraceae bacterium]|nr:insulinase family protein [Bryobacteraceae bacterium]